MLQQPQKGCHGHRKAADPKVEFKETSSNYKNTLLQSLDDWTEVVTSQPATNLFLYILYICLYSNTVNL